MSDREHDARQHTREAVRALSRPVADPAFRERLGRQFAEGDLPPARRSRGPRGLLWFAPAAVLAAVVAMFLVERPEPRWFLVDPQDATAIEVDGAAPEGRSLPPGARVRASTGEDIELVLSGLVALQLTPGTEMTLPGLMGSPGSRTQVAELVSGEIRVTSGPGFAGRRLLFRTPEARIEVSGTTLALIRDSVATCVCVFEGTVRIGSTHGALTVVEEETRRSVYRDGRPEFTEEIRAMERMKLGMLRDRGEDLLAPAEDR